MKKTICFIFIFTNYISLNAQNIQNPVGQLQSNRQLFQNVQKLNSSDHPLIKKVNYQYDNYEKNDWVKFSETDYEYDMTGNINVIAEKRYYHQCEEFMLFSCIEFFYNNS